MFQREKLLSSRFRHYVIFLEEDNINHAAMQCPTLRRESGDMFDMMNNLVMVKDHTSCAQGIMS